MDLFVTGELTHHQVAACLHTGSVLLFEHTHTERRFLTDVLQPEMAAAGGGDPEIAVSQWDADPLQTY